MTWRSPWIQQKSSTSTVLATILTSQMSSLSSWLRGEFESSSLHSRGSVETLEIGAWDETPSMFSLGFLAGGLKRFLCHQWAVLELNWTVLYWLVDWQSQFMDEDEDEDGDDVRYLSVKDIYEDT